jgi:hypothetical protein
MERVPENLKHAIGPLLALIDEDCGTHAATRLGIIFVAVIKGVHAVLEME